MSTRAVIARREGDGWRGVYHHSDGYPSGLGCYIFRLIRHSYHGDVAAFLKWAIDDHDGGWSHIFPSGVVKKSPKGGEAWDKSHPQPQCYCHGYFAQRDGIKPGQGSGSIAGCDCIRNPHITPNVGASGIAVAVPDNPRHGRPSCDPLYTEWVYVLDAEDRTMAILESYGEDIPPKGPMAHRGLTADAMAYRHRLKVVVDLDGPEPDWWEMEGKEPLEERQTWVDRYLPPVGEKTLVRPTQGQLELERSTG